MLPVIAIVGRPNVGKSTLFNYLTQSRSALVADMPGVTRDRIYGEAQFNQQKFIVIDTGGLTEESTAVEKLMIEQTWHAIAEADYVLFVVDGRSGLNPSDSVIADKLRRQSKPVTVLVNKCEGLDPDVAGSEFFSLGLGQPQAIAAAHGYGIQSVLQDILQKIANSIEQPLEPEEEHKGIKLAVIGRPNVGKSTLINRMLGEERVVVFDEPGTTRDSIFINMERRGELYTLIDTAGVRRRGRIDEVVEKFSVVKTLQAIETAHVIILVIDAQEGLVDQDLHLLGFALEAGKGLVIAVNKWDGLEQDQRATVKRELDRKLTFADFAEIHFISALHGTGVGDLFKAVKRSYQSAMKKLPTPLLTRLLQQAIIQHQPPLVNGRRIKLRYAHAGGHNPPCVVIHGNQTDKLPDAYRRYLSSVFRKGLRLVGTPVVLELKNSENPYRERKNVLTDRQMKKRRRLRNHKK